METKKRVGSRSYYMFIASCGDFFGGRLDLASSLLVEFSTVASLFSVSRTFFGSFEDWSCHDPHDDSLVYSCRLCIPYS
jgi:hypothetical protein